MTVVPAVSALVDTANLAVSLPRYAQIIGYSECAFFGIIQPDPPAVHSNKPLWKKSERDQVAHFLAEAQAELESEIGYLLSPRWVVGDFADASDDRLVDQQRYSYPLIARWSRVIEAGIRATSSISSGEAVDHTSDPAVMGPVATTVTDEDEIKVYHPGTEIEIHPSDISISGGNVTISIPRARLLTEAGEAETAGVDYTNTGPAAGLFEQTVDVTRVYNDNSTNATLVWPHSCSGVLSCCNCSEYTHAGCIYVKDHRNGILEVLPATYSGGTWTVTSSGVCCGRPALVRLNYRAGLRNLTKQAEDAIVRLAHSKMPHSPCNCDPANWVWARDRNVPQVLTAERLNCPFGLSDGAWQAWRFAQSMKQVRGYTL